LGEERPARDALAAVDNPLFLIHLFCERDGDVVALPSSGARCNDRSQPERGSFVLRLEKPGFDAATFLASAGLGRRIIEVAPNDTFFSLSRFERIRVEPGSQASD
jgi:predicted RNase H-like nuclease